jgi:hypothetical protein
MVIMCLERGCVCCCHFSVGITLLMRTAIDTSPNDV